MRIWNGWLVKNDQSINFWNDNCTSLTLVKKINPRPLNQKMRHLWKLLKIGASSFNSLSYTLPCDLEGDHMGHSFITHSNPYWLPLLNSFQKWQIQYHISLGDLSWPKKHYSKTRPRLEMVVENWYLATFSHGFIGRMCF